MFDRKKQFEEFVRAYYKDILKYCRFHLNSDQYAAEECTQEVFLTFYSKINTLKNFNNVRAYLFRIADNHINTYIRTATKGKDVISYSLDDNMGIDNVQLSYEEKFDTIEDNMNVPETMNVVLGQLTDKELKLYNTVFRRKEQLNQIAEKENVSKSAIKMRIQRIKAKIRKLAHEALENRN